MHAETPLAHLIGEENQTVEAFIALLREEQALLSSGEAADLDRLPALIARKDAVAETLNRLAERRNAALTSLGLSPDRNGIEAWLAGRPQDTALHNRWQDTLRLAAEARELNRLNGELIAQRLQHNSRALDILQSGGRAPDLYGPDGQYSAAGMRRINDAV